MLKPADTSIGCPEDVTVSRDLKATHIRWQPRFRVATSFGIFSIAMILLLVTGYSFDKELYVYADWVALSLFGMVLVAFVILLQFNRTILSVSADSIQTQSWPFPWPRGRIIRANQISQIYCTERIRKHRNGVSTYHSVYFVRPDNTHSLLFKNMRSREHAIFVEEYIERSFNIQDRHIEGEFKHNHRRDAA